MRTAESRTSQDIWGTQNHMKFVFMEMENQPASAEAGSLLNFSFLKTWDTQTRTHTQKCKHIFETYIFLVKQPNILFFSISY